MAPNSTAFHWGDTPPVNSFIGSAIKSLAARLKPSSTGRAGTVPSPAATFSAVE